MTTPRESLLATRKRESWNERKGRERRRDKIREFAFETAVHVAGADLNRVERVTRDGCPAVQFARPTEEMRCQCGGQLVVLPTWHSRWGLLPTWFCPFCGLEDILQACERISAEAQT